jgi:hypothetical protein
MALPRVKDNLTRVHVKWVGLGDGINVDLGEKLKEFTAELKASLEQETSLFFGSLLASGGTLGDILTSVRGFVDPRLATHYGVKPPRRHRLAEVTYPDGQRSGILTQAGILARYSLGRPVVFRGKYVREQLLCGEIPPPPNIPDIDMENTASAMLSEREQTTRRLAHPICGACHAQMDPLGLAFLQYDPLARWKPNDATGKPIDASADLTGTDVDGKVMNAVDLGQRLARSEHVRACMEEKIFTYALGRDLQSYDACELKQIDAYVQARGGKLAELITAIALSPAFRTRTGGK